MIDTIIFDLDGTLLNTLDDLAHSVNHAMRQMGFPNRTLPEVRSFLGNGVRNLMQQAVPEGTDEAAFEQAFTLFRAHYMEHCMDSTKPYDGIMGVLKELHGLGRKLGIVSNKMQDAVTELNEKFFSQYVSVAIGESATVRRKPSPDSVLLAMERLDARSDRTAYVGDSEVDILTARNAGLPCVSVLWGFRDREFLLEKGATCVVDAPCKLPDALDGLLV